MGDSRCLRPKSCSEYEVLQSNSQGPYLFLLVNWADNSELAKFEDVSAASPIIPTPKWFQITYRERLPACHASCHLPSSRTSAQVGKMAKEMENQLANNKKLLQLSFSGCRSLLP